MNWNSNWSFVVNGANAEAKAVELSHPVVNPNPQPASPYDAMTRDQLLVEWQNLKDAVTKAKDAEMEMRKYIVSRTFPDKQEGTNTLELGNGYSLKAQVKYNYNLCSDVNKIDDALYRIGKLSNEMALISDRLVSWTPNFLLTEYRLLQDAAADTGAPNHQQAKDALKILSEVLTITDAAPSLEIKAPKTKAKK